MTDQQLTPAERDVIDRTAAMSADDMTDWLSKGFRALVANDRVARPFGDILVGFRSGEDITDDLAAIYYSLPSEPQSAFLKALDATFRQMNARRAGDQRALIFVLRLAAKIQNARLLPLLTKKLFVEDAEPSDEERKLRSVALDVAVELSALSPHATENLQNIVDSSLFRSSAAATILLALCSASPDDLIDHLFRLEKQLIYVFGEAASPTEPAVQERRALLLADVADHTPDSIIGGVVEFALRNRNWPLAWLADVLLDEELLASLPDKESSKTLDLLEKLRTRRIRPMVEPDWVRQLHPPTPNLGQRKEDFTTLTSDDSSPEAAEEVFHSMISRLVGEDRSLFNLSTQDRKRLLEDIDLNEVE